MDCFKPIFLPDRGLVPCGKCLACYKRRQDDWTFRLSYEFKNSFSAYFITLTYNEDNIPLQIESGVTHRVLRKRDLQLFFKRFRKAIFPHKVRYFAIGEYGSKTLRPHYHAILFYSDKLDDFYKPIERSWSLGFVSVSEVHFNHFHYVTKYCTTVSDLPSLLRRKEYRPFSLSSRKPAIGYCYLTPPMVHYHRSSLSTVSLLSGRKYSTPKYYREKLFDDSMKMDIRDRIDEWRQRDMSDLMDMDIHQSMSYAELRLQRQQDFINKFQSKLKKSQKL